jgi:hypothetical protein
VEHQTSATASESTKSSVSAATATTASPATGDVSVKPVHKRARIASINTSASKSKFQMPVKRPQSKLADDEGLVFSTDIIKRMTLADDTLCYVPDDAALVLISKSTETVIKHLIELAYLAVPDNRLRVEDLADVTFGARGDVSEREVARLRCLQPLLRPFLSKASSLRQATKALATTTTSTGEPEPTPVTHAILAPEESSVPDSTLLSVLA